jgi:ABC-type multidrug transport system fused ATPase/permease subunit
LIDPVARSLLRFSRIRPWAVPTLVALGFVATLMEGVGIGLMIPLLDIMMGADGSQAAGLLDRWVQDWAGVIAPDTKILVLCIAIFVMILVKTLVMVANVALGARLTATVTHDLRIKLARRLLDVGYVHFMRRDQGQLMNVLEAQTYRTAEAMTLLVQLLTSASAAVVFVLLLLLLSWQLTLLVVITAIPVSLLVRRVAHRASDLGAALVDAYTQLAGRLLELLTAMRTIRVFGLERHELERIEATSAVARGLSARSEALTQSIQPVAELLYTPVLLATLLYGWFSQMPLPSLLAFLLLAFRLPPHLKRLDHARVSLGIYAAGVAELESLLQERDEPPLPSGSVHFDSLLQDIVFDRVTFRHAAEAEPALDSVSFRIPRRSVVAIVGRSGSGKSTVLNLLCRLYDPTVGSIRVDGRPLPEYDLGSWRRRLALSGQDVDLMSGTVRENIEYGAGSLTDSELQGLVAAAHADEFLQAFPDGLETDLGARGLRLSGGQRQRIALARALARKPDLLILDEATNALDEQSEAAIRDTIAGLAGKCTIVIVAHRLELVARADHVVVLAGGRVVAEGPPEQLLAEGRVLLDQA